MNKHILFGFLFLVNIFPAFGSALQDAQQQREIIKVHFKNMIPGTDLNDLKRRGIVPNTVDSGYFLCNPALGTFSTITDLEVVINLSFKDSNNSKTFFNPLPKYNEISTFNLPIEDRKKLDQLSLQVNGKGIAALRQTANGLAIDGDWRCVSLGATWHPGHGGWFEQSNTLYTWFKPRVDANGNEVVFGNSFSIPQ
jgi:hypothetical protein